MFLTTNFLKPISPSEVICFDWEIPMSFTGTYLLRGKFQESEKIYANNPVHRLFPDKIVGRERNGDNSAALNVF